ncbi:MAG: NAD(P)H-hydrate dehydratase, partial [Bacillota bacterium]|nr:NAD(P)H-hydrate dehydratase [Bacillota bacterium]
MELIDSNEMIRELIENNEMLLIYFGSNSCNVCVAIKPKIDELLMKYPKIKSIQVDVENSVEISSQFNIFTIPAILVFINGKETIREARFISIENLSNKIYRYYSLLFEDESSENILNKYILGQTDGKILVESLENNKVLFTEYYDVKSVIKRRNRDSHKGTYGKVGIVSGSKGMAGACVLNLNSALRSGAGLVKGFIPDEIYSVVETMSLEAITCVYDAQNFSYEKLQTEIIDYSDVIATGSGCANLNKYEDILNYILENSNKPLVIDAEGINVIDLKKLKNHKQDIILTPHYGEFARLLKIDINSIRNNIVEKSVSFSKEYNIYLVLKGARTIIVCPDG